MHMQKVNAHKYLLLLGMWNLLVCEKLISFHMLVSVNEVRNVTGEAKEKI